MLLGPGAEMAAFRPPPVEDLTGVQLRRLRATLVGVIDSWRGALEIGLRVGDLLQPREARAAGSAPDGVHVRAGAAPVALSLTPEAAASLLCVNLGSTMPDEPATRLSELDLALLDAWATRALPELVSALGGGTAGEVLRGRPAEIEGAIGVELAFAGERPAGALRIGPALARPRASVSGETLGDHPALLLEAGLMVQAAIASDPLPITDLLTLEQGDVLLFGDKTGVEAALTAGEAVVAEGRPGARAGMRAFRIEGGVLTEREDSLGETSDGF